MNIKKYKYLKISLLVLPLLILGMSFATISFGKDADVNSGLPDIGTNKTAGEVEELKGITNLGGYTKKIFDIAMVVASGLAGLAFIIGVVQYMSSAGNPTAAGEGKNRMISALLGLTLTLGSLIVLKTINPNFEKVGIKQTLESEDFTGVFLLKPGTPEIKTLNFYSVPSLKSWPGYTKIWYFCLKGEDQAFLPYYFLIGYSDENYKGKATKKILDCSLVIDLQIYDFKSYQLIPIWPGIYLWADADCNDIINTNSLTSSQNIGPAGSISIVNSPDEYYMVSEHQKNDYQGACTNFYGKPPTPQQGRPPCTALETANPSSLTIVRLNTASNIGDGITFYQDTNYKGGVTIIDKSKIEAATISYESYKIPNVAKDIIGRGDISETVFTYSLSPETPTEIRKLCPNLTKLGKQDCPGSAKVYGDYVIKFKATNTTGTDSSCKVFSNTEKVTDFYIDNVTLFGGGSRELKSIEILQGTK